MPAKLVWRGGRKKYKRSWKRKGIKGYSAYSVKRDSKRHSKRSRKRGLGYQSKHHKHYAHAYDAKGMWV